MLSVPTQKEVVPYGIPKEAVWMTDVKKASDYAGQPPRKSSAKFLKSPVKSVT